MRPTESEIKRCQLARGVFLLLHELGMVDGSYAAVGPEEWKSRAPGLLKRSLFTPSPHCPVGSVFTKVPGDGLYVNAAGKTLPFDSFWRSLRNLVRLRCWPHEDSLVSIVEVALAARSRLPPEDAPERDAWRDRAVRFLIGYRSYLESTETELLEPEEYLRRHSDPARVRPVAAGSLPLHRLLERIDASIAYLGRHLRYCDNSFHGKLFEVYVAQLELFRERAREEYDYDGVVDFRHLAEEVKRLSFQNEALLLKGSLETGRSTVYFSDSGFAETHGRRAVWVEDGERVGLLRLSRNAGRLHQGTSFHRLVLLDSVKARDYEKEQLLNLTRDVTSLLVHGVQVSIGEMKVAREIDPEFFNYAISEDGILMRACRGHDAWRVAKVPSGHCEHRRLLESYRAMASESCGRILKLGSVDLAGRESGVSPPKNLVSSPVYDKLTEWLAG